MARLSSKRLSAAKRVGLSSDTYNSARATNFAVDQTSHRRGRGSAFANLRSPARNNSREQIQSMTKSVIAEHSDRARIEYDLTRGIPVRRVAKKYGINQHCAYRYLKKMPPQLKAAHLGKMLRAGADLEKLRIDESEGLLQNLATQRARLLLVQDHAMETENGGLATQISGAIHRNLELVAKLLGELASHQVRTNISVLVQPEYLDLRAALVRALQPYPDARAAVAAVLHRIESKAAERPASPPMIEGKAEAVADAH